MGFTGPATQVGQGIGELAPYLGGTTLAAMPTLKQRLELAVKQAKERLEAAQEAKEIFDRNPDLERLLNIMQKGLF